jgi:hypothetical protein
MHNFVCSSPYDVYWKTLSPRFFRCAERAFSELRVARSIFVLYNLERYPHFHSTDYYGSIKQTYNWFSLVVGKRPHYGI